MWLSNFAVPVPCWLPPPDFGCAAVWVQRLEHWGCSLVGLGFGGWLVWPPFWRLNPPSTLGHIDANNGQSLCSYHKQRWIDLAFPDLVYFLVGFVDPVELPDLFGLVPLEHEFSV